MKEDITDASAKIGRHQIEGYLRERAEGREFFRLYERDDNMVID